MAQDDKREGRFRYNPRRMKRIVLSLLLLAALAHAQTSQKAEPTTNANERGAARYLESIRKQPLLLYDFLHRMPKGGDLHNHVTGAVYAETYIQWAAGDGLCVRRTTLVLEKPPCDEAAGRPPAARALADPVLYREMVDAYSMRHFSGALPSGHDHFFDMFGKVSAVSHSTHVADMIAETVSRAGQNNVQYMELMVDDLDQGKGLALGANLGWDDRSESFESFRQRIDQNGAAEIVASGRKYLDQLEAGMRKTLRCDASGPQRDPGCDVTVRYIFEVYRGLPKAMVFAQTQIGFAMAAADPRIVSVNPVMPEDGYTEMHDFDLHMRMFQYFHQRYPQVKLTMHAGELSFGLVPPDGLRNHIRDTAQKAGAQRIGHGVDVMWEDDPASLLRELRDKKIAVEICLTSNDMILGVRGPRHPLNIYLSHGVPVTIATDDEGVARSTITNEYQRAVEEHGLTYPQLKQIAGNAIEYSFADDTTKQQLRARLAKAWIDFEKDCCGK